MSNNTIHLITTRNWMVEELKTTSWEVEHSWGFDLPHHTPDDSWWLPQAQAVMLLNTLQKAGLPEIRFTAPNPNLLSLTPKEFTGRTIQTLTVSEATNSLVPWESGLWWKLATAKNEHFPADVRDHEEMMETIKTLNLPASTILQVSTPIAGILSEHRFFIASRRRKHRILASSGYMKNNELEEDPTKHDQSHVQQATELIRSWLKTNQEPLPPGFVADVAVTRNGPVILEFNPAWCAGWYAADLEQVLNTVRRSVHPTETEYKHHRWVPDPHLTDKYGNRVMHINP